KYGEDPSDGGLGGHGGAGASATSGSSSSSRAASASAASSAASTGTGGLPSSCVDGGAIMPRMPVGFFAGPPTPIALTDDANFVYFTAIGPDPSVGSVYRAPKSGATPTDIVTGLVSPQRIQVDAKNVYYVTHMQNTSSEIWKLDKTSSGNM